MSKALNQVDEIEVGSEEPAADGVSKRKKNAKVTPLRYLRRKHGFTLASLSEATNISVSYLSRLESGTRRLNSDLIYTLSNALGCEPASLLQDSYTDSPDNKVMFRNKGAKNTYLDLQYDIPTYAVVHYKEDSGKDITYVDYDNPLGNRFRPVEFIDKKDIIAIKIDSNICAYFGSNVILYLHNIQNLAPETLVLVEYEKKVVLKHVWSITPTTVQLCDVDQIDVMKKTTDNNIVSMNRGMLELPRSSIKTMCKVVGHLDLSI